MNNFSLKLKMFLKNKNTVTILCALIGITVLLVGYNWRINSAVKPVKVPYAKVTIQPRTEITKDMIGYKEIAKAAISDNVITDPGKLIDYYSAASTIIPKGSMFYKETIVKKEELPDAALYDMPLDETLYYLPVNITTSYSNSILPKNYIDIYVQTITTDEDGNTKVMVGKLISNVLVRAVKTSNGLNVFENSEEARIPATIIFSVKEDIHLLLRKAASIGNLSSEYKIDIIPVPNTTGFDPDMDEAVVTKVSNEYLKEFIEEKSIYIPEDEIVENVDPNEDEEEDNDKKENDKNNNNKDESNKKEENNKNDEESKKNNSDLFNKFGN